jgi:hypothetical protein
MNWKLCYKEILQAKMLAGTKQVYEIANNSGRTFQVSAHVRDCKVVLYNLEGNDSCELNILMYEIYICNKILLF